jgi:DNA mismatch repair protein MutS2
MMQSGFLVPMDPSSTMGIFGKLFLEIGDEQSIDQDLSTYSSHLTGIKTLLENVDSSMLFMIDEFGAGTDPQLGGALAEACLEILIDKKAMGIVTTHYSNLKLLADKHDTIVNGAMLFDSDNMKPLYVLKTGKPGSSFAFEIASRIGLPKEVIDMASQKTGKTQLDFEKQLQDLEGEKLEVEKRKKQFRVADDFLSEQIEKYEKRIKDLEAKKLSIIEEARKEAEKILSNSNRLIENTIKEIREAEAEKSKTRQIRKEFETRARKVIPKKEKSVTREVGKESKSKYTKFQVGEWVTKKGDDQDITGQIIEIKGKNVTLDLNGINFRTSLDSLVRADEVKYPQPRSSSMHARGDLRKKAASFNLTIDLRGKTVEEALKEVQGFIDDAILLSLKEVSILHGKGDGILRKAIREYLSEYDEVEGFRDEHVERGGPGITIVTLK